MTNEEIIEGNKIIAQFMGVVYYLKGDPFMKIYMDEGDCDGIFFQCQWHPDCDLLKDPNSLVSRTVAWIWEPEKQWCQLMPVVDRIENLPIDKFHGKFIVHISSNTCTIQGSKLNTTPENYHPAYFADYALDTKIESVWYACVCFIKWYVNKNQNEEKNH